MKRINAIDLKNASILGAVPKKYLSGELSDLISFSPDLKGYEKALAARHKYTIDRATLVKVLLTRNANAGEKTINNIQLLKEENTFTVTTGHQLCLFTGPLYFIYKILHTIKLAEELKQHFPNENFVPVYWMASEDHDFAEINHIQLYGKKVVWDFPGKGAVGKLRMDEPSLKFVLSELSGILGETPKAREIFSTIEKAYANGNLADATHKLVNYLFDGFGLIVLDADHPELKKQFSSIFVKEMQEEFVHKTVTETNDYFEKNNLKVQVTPREINIFYLQKNSRERIIKDQEVYTTADYSKRWSREELIQEIQLFPENFSPNVLMRALYQETILPNVTYVGGGGEISYWLQMKAMFESAQIPFPILTVRHSFICIDTNSLEKWRKLGFDVLDFLLAEEELVKRFIERNADSGIDFTKETEELKLIYQNITEKLAKTDATLKGSGEAEWQKTLKSLESLEGKLRKAEKQKHEQSLTQIKQLKSKLFPEGELQERVENFLPLYLKTNGQFLKEVYSQMNGLGSQLLFLEIN